MGGCQSTDYIILPKQKIEIKENKFKQIIKYKFILPEKLKNKLEIHTSNGKITDYITKNDTPCKITYQEIQIDKMLSNDNKFIDPEFKNNNQSIGNKKQIIENIQWKRPQEFMKQNYKIFQSLIEPLDIKQGKLGNCYFLSAITAISQYPFIVKRIFQSTETSTYGFYGVWLFIDGLWKCIVIDDYFPLNANRPIYSRNHGNQLWVMILQKAYAKVFGSYIAIESGLTGIAMNTLTGAPYQYLCKNSSNHIEIDIAWQFLTQHIAKNHLLTGSSENNDRNSYLGLISTHAYTIIDIKQIHLSTKHGRKKQRILKLSNPWGKYQWKGRWSQYSDIWNQQLRQQLKFQKKDDGLFWISLDDFCQNFGQICVCKYNKNYISTSLCLEFSNQTSNNYKGIFIHTSNRNCGYLSLIQQDHRYFPEMNYQYSLVRIIIMQIDKSTQTMIRYINDMIDCDHDATIQLELQPGDYYVIIQIDWKNKFTRKAVLNYYGQHPISIMQDLITFNIQDIFNQIVLLHQKYTQQQRIYQYAKDTKIVRITGSIAGYVYYHYTNDSTHNNYVCQTVSLKEHKFIKVHAELKDNQFTVKVYPNQKRIVLLKVQKQGNGFYSFSTKIQFYILEKYSIEKLKELADRKPTKVKKRQIEGKQIDVRIKTYNYSGGIVLLYQNRMDKYAYVEEITFQLENLALENQQLNHNHKLQIDLEPQSEKILSFVVCSPGNQVIFRTKMSFYLNSPEFKF